MKICLPSMGYRSLDERTAMECRRSQYYTIVDTDGTAMISIPGEIIYSRGLRTLSRWLSRMGVEAVVARDMDDETARLFEEDGIRVFLAARETLRESVEAFLAGHGEDMLHMPHRRHEIEITVEN